MYVKLLTGTMDAEYACGLAAAMTRGPECRDYMTSLRNAMDRGHMSVTEHASFMFQVLCLSRVTLQQLVRHRLASFSVESQRYHMEEDVVAHTVRPASWSANGFEEETDAMLAQISELYERMIQRGVPKEDARYILPEGMETNLVFTMNARQLRHFMSLRCCNRAQWEIRALADKIREIMMAEYPTLFAECGAPCQCGMPCPEGKHSCGRPRTEKTEDKK